MERTRRRILYMHGGMTVRALAKREGEVWSYKRKSKWATVPQGAVERHALDKDVVANARKARKEIDGKDHEALAKHAGWLLSEGLLNEGLEQLASLLNKDADLRSARNQLTRNAFRFALPHLEDDADGLDTDELGEFLRYAARSPATLREMLLVELGKLRSREALREQLAGELFNSTPGRRSFAALAISRLFAGAEVKRLLNRAVLDSSEDVRRHASQALYRSNMPELIMPVVRAMNTSRNPRVRAQAAEALGNMGYAAAVEPLVSNLSALASVKRGSAGHQVPHSHIFIGKQTAYIQDFDVEVAQFQAVADPSINVLIEGSVLDVGVHGIREIDIVLQRASVHRSLSRLTGAIPGRYSRDWLRWWEENKHQYISGRTSSDD